MAQKSIALGFILIVKESSINLSNGYHNCCFASVAEDCHCILTLSGQDNHFCNGFKYWPLRSLLHAMFRTMQSNGMPSLCCMPHFRQSCGFVEVFLAVHLAHHGCVLLFWACDDSGQNAHFFSQEGHSYSIVISFNMFRDVLHAMSFSLG